MRETSTKQPSIRDLLQYELREHMTIALDYKGKIDEAKTEYKKKYYRKKLKKNNEQAARVLTALERLNAQDTAMEQANKEQTNVDEVTDE